MASFMILRMECECLKYFQQFASTLVKIWPPYDPLYLSGSVSCLIFRSLSLAARPPGALIGRECPRPALIGCGRGVEARVSNLVTRASHAAHISNGPGLLLRLRSSISPTLRIFRQNGPQNTEYEINILKHTSLFCFLLGDKSSSQRLRLTLVV